MPADPTRTDDDLLANAIPIPHEDEDDDGPTSVRIDDDELEPLDVGDLSAGDMEAGEMSSSKIHAFGVRKAHDEHWNRTPNTTGSGAIHCKTFVTKLRLDAIEHMDQQVNEWLDAHPEYEVKFVTTSIGTLFGKNKEEALFMNVWV